MIITIIISIIITIQTFLPDKTDIGQLTSTPSLGDKTETMDSLPLHPPWERRQRQTQWTAYLYTLLGRKDRDRQWTAYLYTFLGREDTRVPQFDCLVLGVGHKIAGVPLKPGQPNLISCGSGSQITPDI